MSTRQPLNQTETTTNTVFIVIDICYPSSSDFYTGKGITTVDSVHSTQKAANARAKKIIYNGGPCDVDIDKIIDEVRNGLYTGIGIGSDDKKIDGRCYARKCEVESLTVDEDEDSEGSGSGGEEGDFNMG